MAKVFTRINIIRRFRRIINNDVLQGKIGRKAIARMKKVIRAGASPVTLKRFPRLAPATKKERRYWATRNKPSKFFSAVKSNLHKSGQLINSLAFNVKTRAGRKRAEIFMKDARKNYKGVKSTPTNPELAEHLEDKGFKFFGKLDPKGIAQIKKIVLSEIKKDIRRARRSSAR